MKATLFALRFNELLDFAVSEDFVISTLEPALTWEVQQVVVWKEFFLTKFKYYKNLLCHVSTNVSITTYSYP
jgi:hypothetical protein